MKTNFEKFAAENRKLDNKLTNENYLTYDKIMASLNPVRMGKVRSELVRRDLLDLGIAAQQQKETLEQALGEDTQSWCSEVQAANGFAPQKEMIMEIVYQLLAFFAALSSISAILAACVFQLKRQLTYPVTWNWVVLVSFALIGGVWAVYSVLVAPRLAARRGLSPWLRFLVFLLLLNGPNWILGFFYPGGIPSSGITIPWGVQWGLMCVMFAAAAYYRRKRQNAEFIRLTGRVHTDEPNPQ